MLRAAAQVRHFECDNEENMLELRGLTTEITCGESLRYVAGRHRIADEPPISLT
jgi:hypothetical protein